MGSEIETIIHAIQEDCSNTTSDIPSVEQFIERTDERLNQLCQLLSEIQIQKRH